MTIARRRPQAPLLTLFIPGLFALAAFAQPAPPVSPPEPPAAAQPAPVPAPTAGAPRAARSSRLPAGVKAIKDIEYAAPDGKPIRLDLYLPEKDPDHTLPLIIWVHGGGWEAGSKAQCPGARFAADAFAVASIQYRFTDVAPFPAQIHDCKAAVRFLRAHAKEYNIDPDRIGAWGASAGGHLVALLGTSGGAQELEGDLGNPDQSSRVQAVCDWFGPTDFTDMPESWGRLPALRKFFGGPVEAKKDLARQASPVAWTTADDAPCLIMHGENDPLVPMPQSEKLLASLKAAGVEAELKVIPNAGHGLGFGPNELNAVERFFADRLKPPAAATPAPGPGATPTPTPSKP